MYLNDEVSRAMSLTGLMEKSPGPTEVANTKLRRRQPRQKNPKKGISKREARANPVTTEALEEQAKKDLELLKLDFSHREHMTQRQIDEVERLQRKLFQEDSKYAPVVEPRTQDEIWRAGRLAARRIDPRRSAKIARRRETREKNAIEDLENYKLDPGISLSRKRMNKVQRLLKSEIAERKFLPLQYRDTMGKSRQDFKAAEGSGTPALTKTKQEFIMPLTQYESDASCMQVRVFFESTG